MTDIASTSLGQLRGVRVGEVTAWLGVPYAKPPIGDRRFKAPIPVEPWTGVRDALALSPAAPQLSADSPVAEPIIKKIGTSEDCLYLNIWSPAADGAKRPVLVWIHGGAFMMGTGATYDGTDFATMGDIVVVTINYRLGVLGFVGFGSLWDDPRFDDNLGIRDQIAALAWVREHIGAFGGDPDRITIAGESAGAVAVSLLMLIDAPPFRAAIAQSGAISLIATRERGIASAKLYADRLGGPDELLAASTQHLVELHQQVMFANLGTVTSRPFLDGRVLPATPADLFTRPTRTVPLLLGSNHDEATLFAMLRMLPTERPEIEALARTRIAPDRIDAVLDGYTPDRAGALMLARDAMFTVPMIHFAERHPGPTWMYRFDWPTPAFGGVLGAMHALELFLMWMDPDRRGTQIMLGGPPSAELRALAERMKRYWIAFVRDGDPGPSWPRYDTQTRTTRIFHLDDQLVDDPEGRRRIAWHGLDGLD
ncbi:MAG TPA: carboxylesterase/lipase family protein [Kofleriaceae bacterium]|nr:carboxylesterase/lipase family protein [Kofleriaceae bacterium]